MAISTVQASTHTWTTYVPVREHGMLPIGMTNNNCYQSITTSINRNLDTGALKAIKNIPTFIFPSSLDYFKIGEGFLSILTPIAIHSHFLILT